MYEKDILIQEYLSDNVRFADLVNVYLFDGSCVVTPICWKMQIHLPR